MSIIEARYTQQQRDAAAEAFEDRKIRPASRVVALAAAGELEHEGQQLAPFEIREDYVRDLARDLRKRRRGLKSSALAQQPHRDAIEQLRRRLINAADAMLADYEKRARRSPEKAEPERLRQIIRVVREAAALPARTDPAPPAPGQREGGERNGSATQGGLGRQILRDLARETEGSPDTQREPVPTTSAQKTKARHNSTDESAATPAGATRQHETRADAGSGARGVALPLR